MSGTSIRQLVSSKLVSSLVLWLAIGAMFTLPLATMEVSAHPARAAAANSELYFGLMYPETPDITALGKYETQIGKHVSLVLWYQSWEQNNQLQAFPTDQMEAVRQHGSIPVLAWYPDAYTSSIDQPQFSLAKIANGTWDAYIRQYATAVKAWGHPFFLRFASEMNGEWVPWSESHSGNSAGQFVQAWRHVHDIFVSVGATNATWVWCPNIEGLYTTPLEDLYPGNAYVDWAGLDGYNYSNALSSNSPWQSFAQVFSETYDHLLKLIPRTMPIMIGETGSVEQGGSKPAWITDALTTQLPTNFPQIKALIWFDSSDGNINLRVDTSPQSLTAFQHAIASDTYQANDYSTLDQMPIPAPEHVVLPPPPAPVTATATVPAVPISQSYSAGPSSGSIEVVDAEHSKPIAQAELVFQSGVTTKTNATGLAHMPSQDPKPILKQVVVGSVIIHTQLVLDPQRGYQIQINLTTGKVTHILVHLLHVTLLNLWPIVIQFGLFILIAIIAATVIIRGLVRRRRKASERRRREQPAYTRF